MGLLDSVGGFVKDAGDGVARAAGNGYKAASDTWNSALEDAKAGANVVAASFRDSDLAAPFASGTNRYDAFVIIPCSASTLSKISYGIGDTLITRAAQWTSRPA